jgi:hypothetical protein
MGKALESDRTDRIERHGEGRVLVETGRGALLQFGPESAHEGTHLFCGLEVLDHDGAGEAACPFEQEARVAKADDRYESPGNCRMQESPAQL